MIEQYFGLPRAGKSFTVVKEVIYPHVVRGVTVYHNVSGIEEKLSVWSFYTGIPLYVLREKLIFLTSDEIKSIDYTEPTKEEISKYEDWLSQSEMYKREHPLEKPRERLKVIEENCLLVIDEVQNVFPSVKYSANESGVRFFTKHGHFNINCVLITQRVANYDKRISELVENTHYIRNMSSLGMGNKYKRELYFGASIAKEFKLATKYDKYEQKYFSLYQSLQVSDHSNLKKGENLFKNPKVILIIMLPLLSIPLGFWGLYNSPFGTAFRGDNDPYQKKKNHEITAPTSGSKSSNNSTSVRGADSVNTYLTYHCSGDLCFLTMNDGSTRVVSRANSVKGVFKDADKIYHRAYTGGDAKSFF